MSSPESPAPQFTTRVRVRYAETDAAGVVYYGNYLTYFEVVRLELLRALEVGEVVAVVDDPGGVGLGVAHAHARRELGGWRLGRAHHPQCSMRPSVARSGERHLGGRVEDAHRHVHVGVG